MQAFRKTCRLQEGSLRMVRGEKGYILPFSMLLTTAILMVSMSAASIFVSRFTYLDIMEEGYTREAMLVYTVEKILKDENTGNGSLSFTEGVVRYEVIIGENTNTLVLSLNMNDKVFEPVTIIYENETKEILDWE